MNNKISKHVIKLLATACLLTIGSSAVAACRLEVNRTVEIAKIIRENGGYDSKNFEEVCGKINKAQAKLIISAGSSVLNNVSIGWAILTVGDRNLDIANNSFYSSTIYTDTHASQDRADQMIMMAINKAMQDWNKLDDALVSLNESRQSVGRALKK